MNELECAKQILEVAFQAMSIGENKTATALVQISVDLLKEWAHRYGETL